jgi:hypothetical protein
MHTIGGIGAVLKNGNAFVRDERGRKTEKNFEEENLTGKCKVSE